MYHIRRFIGQLQDIRMAFWLRFTTLLVQVVIATTGSGQEPEVVYELLEGSLLGHRKRCNSADFEDIKVELRGTFKALLSRSGERLRSLDALISDIDVRSITGPDYHITGTAGFTIILSRDSPSGLPGLWGEGLSLDINGIHHVSLTSELGWTEIFPPVTIEGIQSAIPVPEDCFGGRFVAAPIAEDAVKFFRRGDPNADGNTDISDAVLILQVLFFGEKKPGCMDAADANDDGRVDLADALFLLEF